MAKFYPLDDRQSTVAFDNMVLLKVPTYSIIITPPRKRNAEYKFIEVPDDHDGVYRPSFQVWQGHKILFNWSCIRGLSDYTNKNTSMPFRVRNMLKELTKAQELWFNESLNGNYIYPGDLVDHDFGFEWKIS